MTPAAEPKPPDGGNAAEPDHSATAGSPTRTATPWRTLLTSWLLARVVVISALTIEPVLFADRRRDSLWQWDGYWYRAIAEHGYDHTSAEGIRFFPGYPLLGRWLGAPIGGHAAIALVVIANVCAFGYAALAYRLALAVGLSTAAARRVIWIVSFSPAAFVLVMAYSEAMYGVLLAASLLAARQRRWWIVALIGLIVGLTRPTGVVLALPTLVEAWSSRAEVRSDRRKLGGICAAIIAPVAGLAAYLGWTQGHFHDALLPLRTQTSARLRGGVAVNPLHTLTANFSRYVHGDFSQPGFLLHVLWLLLALFLFVQCMRRMPPAFTAFTAATLALAITTRDLYSFERYAGSALPLLLVAASLIANRKRQRVALGAGIAVMAGYALVTFGNAYVP